MHQIIVSFMALFLMPLCMGFITSSRKDTIMIVWVSGFMYEWAVVFCISVPLIIRNGSLSDVLHYSLIILLVLSLVGICKLVSGYMKKDAGVFRFDSAVLSKTEIIYLGLFIAIVLFQMYKAVFYAYEDGDDAFYIATAQAAATSDTMYRLDAYFGIPSEPNFRYALAPFPVWLACLSKAAGINVAIVAHLIIPPLFLLITYIIYNEISKLLFDDREKRYMFLSLVALYIMFENVSTSTQGTFLITRARQGKEALANIILPFIFLFMFNLIKQAGKLSAKGIVLLILVNISAALCSLLGNVLVPLMLFPFFIYACIKKMGFITCFGIAISVVPNLLVALYYMRL